VRVGLVTVVVTGAFNLAAPSIAARHKAELDFRELRPGAPR